MTNSERDRLRQLAAAATPGEWWLSENYGDVCAGPDGPEAVEVGALDFNSADTAFVIAANPQTMLGLLDEIGRLQQQVEALRQTAGWGEALEAVCEANSLRQQLAAAQQECEHVRKNNGAMRTAIADLLDALAQQGAPTFERSLEAACLVAGRFCEPWLSIRDVNDECSARIATRSLGVMFMRQNEQLEEQLSAMTAARDEWMRRAKQHGCNIDDGDPDCG